MQNYNIHILPKESSEYYDIFEKELLKKYQVFHLSLSEIKHICNLYGLWKGERRNFFKHSLFFKVPKNKKFSLKEKIKILNENYFTKEEILDILDMSEQELNEKNYFIEKLGENEITSLVLKRKKKNE